MQLGPSTPGDGAATDRGPSEGVAAHIARKAAQLFANRGYHATSVREIVEAAGVAKPTLYYHFGSKEGLAQALLNVPLERVNAEVRRALDAGGDPVATLVAMIEIHFAFFRDDPDRARFVYALFFGPPGSGPAVEMTRYGEQFERFMEEGIGRLVEAGIVAPGRAGAFLAAVRGLIVVHSVDFLYRGANLGPDLAHHLVSDLLRGFGATARGSEWTRI